MFSSKLLYCNDPAQSIQKIIEIAAEDLDDFMYVNFRVFGDGFFGTACHTGSIGSNDLIRCCDDRVKE